MRVVSNAIIENTSLTFWWTSKLRTCTAWLMVVAGEFYLLQLVAVQWARPGSVIYCTTG